MKLLCKVSFFSTLHRPLKDDCSIIPPLWQIRFCNSLHFVNVFMLVLSRAVSLCSCCFQCKNCNIPDCPSPLNQCLQAAENKQGNSMYVCNPVIGQGLLSQAEYSENNQ